VNTDQLTNPLVILAIEAMNAGDRQGWFNLFASDATVSTRLAKNPFPSIILLAIAFTE